MTTYSISPTSPSINENAGSETFTITRSNTSQSATVYVSTVQDQGSSNPSNEFYNGLLNDPITFAAGQSSVQVPLTINDAHFTTGNETFRLIAQQNASDPTSTYLATDNFTILNNDVTPTTYSISPTSPSINENAGSETFTITRSNTSQSATVYVSTVQDQGSSNPSNEFYNGLLNDPITFAAGQSSVQVPLTINDAHLTTGNETFRLIAQQNASDPTSTYRATDNFTILNNDVTPTTYSISPTSPSINENAGSETFTITRSNTSQSATVYVSTVQDQGSSNPSNEFYNGLLNDPITFAAGQTSVQVPLTINDAHLTSGSETFRLIAQQNALRSDEHLSGHRQFHRPQQRRHANHLQHLSDFAVDQRECGQRDFHDHPVEHQPDRRRSMSARFRTRVAATRATNSTTACSTIRSPLPQARRQFKFR